MTETVTGRLNRREFVHGTLLAALPAAGGRRWLCRHGPRGWEARYRRPGVKA